jgi:hypothetical protein
VGSGARSLETDDLFASVSSLSLLNGSVDQNTQYRSWRHASPESSRKFMTRLRVFPPSVPYIGSKPATADGKVGP